jgi:apoptosis-inducing factor 2
MASAEPFRHAACCMQVDESTRTVTLSNGNALEYDYLIVATGSLGPRTLGAALSTTTKAGILKHFQDMQAAIAGAQRILVVGGGPVGLELAGELAHYTKGKQITLVSSKG